MSVVEKIIVKPAKFKTIGNKLIQNGERIRIEYSGKQLQKNAQIAEFVKELGLKKPKVLVGVNGRGNSAVAGITVKDGDTVVLRAAGGVDYTFGEQPLIQLRGRVAEGQGARLNMIADLNKSVDAENMAVSMSNKGGKLDVSVDSDMLSGNFKADMNSKEMRIPQVKRAYDKMMKIMTNTINGNKGVKVVKEKTAEALNGIKYPFGKGKNYAKVAKVETKFEPKEFKDDKIKSFVNDIQTKAQKVKEEKKIAEEMKWKQLRTDEDCMFLLDKAKKLGIRYDDPEILKDPDVIKRFGLE